MSPLTIPGVSLMSEQPTLQEQAAFFDEWNKKHRNVAFDAVEPESKARGERVLRILSALPVKRPLILEIGCGTGWLTERLLSFGPTTAIDLSPRAIEIAKRRGLDVTLITGDFFKHEFPERCFDIVVCLETVAYVSDQRLFIEKLASSIKYGGYFILTSVNKFVYDRRSDIGPPKAGQIRKWIGRRALRKLLKPMFRVLQMTTVLPKGDTGILRVVHSYRVNRFLERVFEREAIIRAQEKLGFGHTVVILAQRRGE